MSDFDEELRNTVVEESHPFEIELNVLVKVNHQLTVEGITKLEEDEIARTRDSLGLEDPDLVDSQVRWQQSFYVEMRRAANHLAVVGLVTRLEHWIARFVRLNQLPVSSLCKNIKVLNDSLHEVGPVKESFFKDLVTVRDSVIHADSKAKWQHKRTREVAKHYRNGGELEVTEDQLKDAISKAIEQVKWYDEKFTQARSKT